MTLNPKLKRKTIIVDFSNAFQKQTNNAKITVYCSLLNMNLSRTQLCSPHKVGVYKKKRKNSQTRFFKKNVFFNVRIFTEISFKKMRIAWLNPTRFLFFQYARAPLLKLHSVIEFMNKSIFAQIRNLPTDATKLQQHSIYMLKRCQETSFRFLMTAKYRCIQLGSMQPIQNILVANSWFKLLSILKLKELKLKYIYFACTKKRYSTLNTRTPASLMTDTSNSRSSTFRLKIAQTLLCTPTPSCYAA